MFSNIHQYSAMVSHIEGHQGISRHIQALLRHIEPYSGIFRTPYNPCIYSNAIFRILAYLEPEAYSRASQTCKMIRHIQRPGLVRTVFSGSFKDIYRYSGILIHIQPHSQARN